MKKNFFKLIGGIRGENLEDVEVVLQGNESDCNGAGQE